MIMIRYLIINVIESFLHRPLTQLHYPRVAVKSASVLIVFRGPEGILRGCSMNMSGHEGEVTGGGNKREDKFVTQYFW